MEWLILAVFAALEIAAPTGAALFALTTAATVAVSFGISYVASKLLGAPGDQREAGGVELDLRVDANIPQALIVGRAVTAGSLAYAETYGKRGDIDNSDLIQIIAIADHPCAGLVKVFIDAQEATLAAAGAGIAGQDFGTSAENRGQVAAGYDDKIALQFYDGTQTTADALAVAGLSAHSERPYTSARVGRGITYARIHSIYDKEKVSGPLRWRFVVDGIKLYNPALDTTVGGSGTHRWGDLATHAFTSNLAVIAYNILRGIRVKDSGGTPRHFYGLENTPAANLPLVNWFAAIAECDVEIDDEPQFHGGAEISVDTEPMEAIRQILKSCDGRLSELGGVYKLHVGAPGLPVISYDDGVLRANAGDDFKPILPLTQRINYVTGSYTSPEEGWVPKVTPPRTDAGMEVADGRRLPADLNMPMVQSAAHIQRLQKQMLLRSRRERRHTEPLPPSCFGLEPGDIVERNSVRNGYVDKLFEVDGVDLDSNLNSVVSLIEVDHDDYDWDGETDLIDQPTGSLVVSRPAPKIIEGFDAEGYIHQGAGGTMRPGISVTWDAPDDGDLVRVEIQVRLASAPTEIATAATDEPEAEQLIYLASILSLTQYEVRGRFVSFQGISTDWSLWIEVTTPDARMSQSDLERELDARIEQVGKILNLHLVNVRKNIDSLAASLAAQIATIKETEGWIRTGAGAQFEENRASVETAMIAIANAEEALAAFIVTVETEFATNDAVTDAVATAKAEAILTSSSNANASLAAALVTLTTLYETISNSTTKISVAKAEAISTASSNASSAIAVAISNLSAVYETITNSTNKIATAKSEAISTAQSNADSAVASAISSLSAVYETISNVTSKISTAKTEAISTAVATSDAALASFIQQVFATTGAGTARGFIRFVVASTASGAIASFAIEVNVGTLGSPNWTVAGIYLDAMAGFSRIRLRASQTRISATDTAAGDVAFREGLVNGVLATVIDSLFLEDGATVNEKSVTFTAFALSNDKPRELAIAVLTVTKGVVQVTWNTAMLSFSGSVGNPTTGDSDCGIELTVDGTQVHRWSFRTFAPVIYQLGPNTASLFRQGMTLSHRVSGLSVGSHTFRIRVSADSESVNSTCGVSSLQVTELRNRVP